VSIAWYGAIPKLSASAVFVPILGSSLLIIALIIDGTCARLMNGPICLGALAHLGHLIHSGTLSSPSFRKYP